MPIEVEQKFRVADLDPVRARLLELGFEPGAALRQADRYYAHPCRDFARTDEALRLRSEGDCHTLTYKGPKLDGQTKTRREIPLALPDGPAAAAAAEELLACLGFASAGSVVKQRRPLHRDDGAFALEAALDDVEGLGCFVELEILVDDDAARAGGLEPARQAMRSLAAELGLEDVERRSYLELRLAQAANRPAARP
jgi:adenylate cyclase class 2